MTAPRVADTDRLRARYADAAAQAAQVAVDARVFAKYATSFDRLFVKQCMGRARLPNSSAAWREAQAHVWRWRRLIDASVAANLHRIADLNFQHDPQAKANFRLYQPHIAEHVLWQSMLAIVDSFKRRLADPAIAAFCDRLASWACQPHIVTAHFNSSTQQDMLIAIVDKMQDDRVLRAAKDAAEEFAEKVVMPHLKRLVIMRHGHEVSRPTLTALMLAACLQNAAHWLHCPTSELNAYAPLLSWDLASMGLVLQFPLHYICRIGEWAVQRADVSAAQVVRVERAHWPVL